MANYPPIQSDNDSFNQHADDEHTPLLAMWYQIRTALAEITIPILAGLKVIWLIAVSPTRFFQAYPAENHLAAMRSPFDLFWRTLTPKERVPLDAAQFLLFAILAAALVGFGFDNANRFSSLVAKTGVVSQSLDAITQQNPAVADTISTLNAFSENETVAAIQSFLDQDIIAAIIELIATLFFTMLFAYLFRAIAGSHVSAARSYAFWLYMTGMQFFTTAITFFIFSIISLPAFNLPELTPDFIFLILETGLLIIWQYLLPLYLLPRIFPPLTFRRTLMALLITHGVFLLVNWLLRAGFTTVILFINSLMERI